MPFSAPPAGLGAQTLTEPGGGNVAAVSVLPSASKPKPHKHRKHRHTKRRRGKHRPRTRSRAATQAAGVSGAAHQGAQR